MFVCRPENKLLLSLSAALSLRVILAVYMWSGGATVTLYIAGLVAVYCMRAANGAIYMPWFYRQVSKLVFSQFPLLH